MTSTQHALQPLVAAHASPWVAAIIIAAVVVLFVARVLYARSRGGGGDGARRIVRCGQGHLFTAVWVPGAVAFRLGGARLLRCPVGEHWSLVRPVNEADLTDEERRNLEEDESRAP